MSKITLNDVGNLIDATTAATVINDNSAAIVAAIDNTLSRDGTTPNQMGSDLDMNSHKILNLPEPVNPNDVVRLSDLQEAVIPDLNFLSGILDAQFGNDQGSLITRKAAGWRELIPGAANTVLKSNGPGADISWGSGSGTGDMISATYDPTNVSADAFNSANEKFLQDGTGAVSRSSLSKMKEIISTKDFGAVGDGVTDDSVAVQKAVNYCQTTYPCKTLYVSGLSRIETPIVIDRPIDGATVADWFIITSSNGGGFTRTTDGVLFTSSIAFTTAPVSQTVYFKNLKLTSSVQGNRYILDDAKFLRIVFDGCTIETIRCLNANVYTQSIYFNNNNIRYWSGPFFQSPNGAYDIKLNPGNLIEHGAEGFILGDDSGNRSVAGCSFIGSVIEGLTGTPIRYGGARGVTISGMYFEGNAGPDINSSFFPSAAISKGVNISGCLFAQTAANQATGSYTSIVWGGHDNAISSGNFCDGRLHLIPMNCRVSIVGDSSLVEVVHSSSANKTNFNADHIRAGSDNPQLYPTSYGSTLWEAGSVVLNSSSTGPDGWRCLTGGSPGTWRAFGGTGGIYVPTVTAVSNVAAVGADTCHYVRNGDYVSLFGNLSVQAGTAGALAQMSISLPIASDLTLVTDVVGLANSASGNMTGGSIAADTVGNKAVLSFQAVSTSNVFFTFSLHYLIK